VALALGVGARRHRACAARKASHELDIVLFGFADSGPEHLERLRLIRDLLTAQGKPGATNARLLCFSGAGFTAGLRAESAAAGDVVLTGLPSCIRPDANPLR
jgi:hypothetical protein